jgi:uridine kinase
VAGESGAGKSETAAALAEVIESEGYKVFIIQQDDFFIYPPKTNAAMRLASGGKVGPEEVRLDLLNEIIQSLKKGQDEITKPLVIFAEDRISSEKIDAAKYQVFLIEGTYTTLLDNIDCRIFIDRDMDDTRSDRLKRNRESQDGFLEKILLTEHSIISSHKHLADIVINKNFDLE